MKKQILFLAFLAIAIFSSLNDALGQAVHVSDPQAPVSCENDALHPMAGVPYEYSVGTDPATGNYLWWATTNQNFIVNGALQNTAANVLVSPDVIPTTTGQYNDPANTAGTIELTWGTEILANAMGATGTPTFVSVYTTGVANCADNLKVYQIEPINAFIVDIKNVENETLAPLAYDATENQCFDQVQTATWSGDEMTYDYGTNVLIFEVVAANFTETWTPTFTLAGLGAGQTATMVWDYDVNFSGTPVTVTSGTQSGTPVSTNVTDTSDGVSIFVRVTIANGIFEGIDNQDITLSVTGVNSANQRDVLATDCTLPDDTNLALQTLNERPEITDNTEVGTFE